MLSAVLSQILKFSVIIDMLSMYSCLSRSYRATLHIVLGVGGSCGAIARGTALAEVRTISSHT